MTNFLPEEDSNILLRQALPALLSRESRELGEKDRPQAIKTLRQRFNFPDRNSFEIVCPGAALKDKKQT